MLKMMWTSSEGISSASVVQVIVLRNEPLAMN